MDIVKVLWKTIMGVLLALLIFMAIFWADTWIFFVLVEVIIFIGVLEYFMMHGVKLPSANFIITAIVSMIIPAYFFFNTLWVNHRFFESLVTGIILIYAFYAVLMRKDPAESLKQIKMSVIPVFFISLMFSYQINLRLYANGGDIAKELLIYFYIVVIMGDTSAYYIGSLFGRHKLAPQTSPKKSVEGAVASFLGSIMYAVLCKIIFLDYLSMVEAIVAAVFISIAAQMGDLFESIIKRNVNVKDSSNILIGHGGVLDRIDSLTLASPLFYFLLLYLK
ncbi:MAG: phosphatidate cytidylyltransferase [Acidobacteria bacterium]|nr:phosphatidate cytidylyltransferase [Acidobacteriota bacterium]